MATGNLSRRIERLEAQAGVSHRIALFEDLMSFTHEAFQLLREGASLDALPHKTFEGTARTWAIELAQKVEQRLHTGEGLDVAELIWLLPLYHESGGLLPARVREAVEQFLELWRAGRVRLVESGVLGGELQIVPEGKFLGNSHDVHVT